MGSPPQPPTPSSFSPFGWPFVAQLAAAPPGRDGSTADSFPFDDNRTDMKNIRFFKLIPCFDSDIICGSPGPQKRDVELDAFDNRKLIPKHIKQNLAIKGHLAVVVTEERVEGCPPRWNPGGVAEWETSLLLDSGASIHAVGEGRLVKGIVLSSIDMWVVCADGTRLRIVGIGTIQMAGFSIPKVHLVDGLKKNLISVSQLDKDHGLCCSFHGKKCEVILADGTVVGGAILQDDGMYELRFLEVPAEQE